MMQNIFLLEPGSSGKRRNYTEKIISLDRGNRISLSDIKIRLKEIRDNSLTHQESLLNELTTVLNGSVDIDLIMADDASQAVEKITEISGSRPIATNKSDVIKSELVPKILSAGIPVIESYYEEFKPFENRFQDYRKVPDMEYESAWNSFGKPVDLIRSRKKNASKDGYRDFVGVMGVNTVSAEDGAVVFLQHMSNIKRIFSQAKEVILVVAINKIVRNLDEAFFQAKCMAMFGSEALPLTLRIQSSSIIRIEDLKKIKSLLPDEKIHIILLDNCRSRMFKSVYKDLLKCIGCRACVKVCPAASYFRGDTLLSPKEYLYYFINGWSPYVDNCIQCRSCRAKCPLEIDIPGMIREAKMEILKGSRLPLADYLLSNADVLQNIGSAVPRLSGVLFDSRTLRWLAEKITGISRKRKIPRMRRLDLASWFYKYEKKDG